jgi:hypothetical protein
VSPEDYVALRHRGDLFDRLQRAAERAMESPDTALAALKLLVRLPAVAEPWGRVYRDAPRRLRPEPSSPTAVLEAAHRLLTARGLPHLSEMLGRARLDQAELPSSSGRLSKYVVLLEPEDLAALDRDATGQEAIRQAIADTASRALDAVASVELRARVG